MPRILFFLLLSGSTSLLAQDFQGPADFLRGDFNADTQLDITDPILSLHYMFLGGAGPGCRDSADANDDSKINLGDPIYSLRNIFLGTARTLPPFATCGPDPTPDRLGCDVYPPCEPNPPLTFQDTIGPEGGVMEDAEGLFKLVIPPGSLSQPFDFNVDLYLDPPPAQANPQLGSPRVIIETTPPLNNPLPIPAELHLKHPQAHMVTPDEIYMSYLTRDITDEGIPNSWIYHPQPSRGPGGSDDIGNCESPIYEFGEYALALPTPLECAPDPTLLEAPSPPDGCRYVGRHVVVNHVYDTDLSTVPLSRPFSSNDKTIILSETVVVDFATSCDVIVAHVFEPIEAQVSLCEVPDDCLTPPPTPPGYRYVGRDVVINSVLTETTVPFDHIPIPSDLHLLRSKTSVVDGTLDCDVIVHHLYERVHEVDTTSFIGPRGGLIESSDGQVAIQFPPGALREETEVQLKISPPPIDREDALVVLPIFELCLDPLPATPFPVGAQLVFPGITTDDFSDLRVAQHFTFPSIPVVQSGDGFPPQQHLLPMPNTNYTEGRNPSIVVTGPGKFTAVAAQADSWQPTAEELAPPPPPEGYEYVGREVVIDHVYSDSHSNVPLTRPSCPDDRDLISSRTRVEDFVTVCDIIVSHKFQKIGHEKPCSVPAGCLIPPPTPVGYRYVGYDAIVDFALEDTTIPLTRLAQPTDLNFIKSLSTAIDHQIDCDIIVRHLFVPIDPPSHTQAVDSNGDAISTPDGFPSGEATLLLPPDYLQEEIDILLQGFPPQPLASGGLRPPLLGIDLQEQLGSEPPLFPSPHLGFLDPPGEDTILGVLVEPKGTVIPGIGIGTPPFQYMLPLDHTRGGEGGGLTVLAPRSGIYGPIPAAQSEWSPSEEALAEPPTPEGYTYLGRSVVIDFVLNEELTTAPIARLSSENDINVIHSETKVEDFVTVCDIIVSHLFAKIGEEIGECVVNDELLVPPEPPPGHRYVGRDVVVNFVYDDELSTAPLERPWRPDDLVLIKSETTVENSSLLWDIIVAHIFEPDPQGNPSLVPNLLSDPPHQQLQVRPGPIPPPNPQAPQIQFVNVIPLIGEPPQPEPPGTPVPPGEQFILQIHNIINNPANIIILQGQGEDEHLMVQGINSVPHPSGQGWISEAILRIPPDPRFEGLHNILVAIGNAADIVGAAVSQPAPIQIDCQDLR